MRAIAWFVLLAALPFWIAACGDDDGDDEGEGHGDAGEHEDLPEVDCDGDVPTFAEVEAFEKCTMCHSSDLSGADRNGAPDDDNWDDEDEATEHADEIAHEVFEGEMPPDDSGITLTNAEKQQLYLWALCM